MANIQEILREVLRAGCQAPSGDNSQPWKFGIQGNVVWVYVIPGTDLPFYNYRLRGSLVALGAAIENMVLAAAHLGAAAKVEYYPADGGEHCVAKIEFSPEIPTGADWFDAIYARATNRHPYDNAPLPDAIRAAAKESQRENPGASVLFLEDPIKIREVAFASSWNERTVLESENIRPEFFQHAVWSQEEELQKRTGLYVKTLEMNLIARLVFRAYSTRLGSKFFNTIGFSRIIARENAKLYSASAAIAAFFAEDDEDITYVRLGRLFERVWLAATKEGWWGHPVTGVPFLMQGIRAGLLPWLPESRKKELETAYSRIHAATGNGSGRLVGLLRLGPAPAPSARSSRFPLEARIFERNI